MTLAEQLSEKELKVLLNYKPKVIDLEALEEKIDRTQLMRVEEMVKQITKR